MMTIRELWFCPQLGINLLSTLGDPQCGRQSFTVTELSTSELEPQFFDVPAGYSVVNRRSEIAPEF
jgi:hypothetical protein